MSANLSTLQQTLARRLIPIFIAWKTLLFVFAAVSPGPGYDTSALIVASPSSRRYDEFKNWSRLERLALNLCRWDALYFVQSAQRDYVYEQEWAFSRSYPLVVRGVVKLCSNGAGPPPLQFYIWAGFAISTLCHLASVLIMFRLLNLLMRNRRDSRVPFIASILHIMSPAGLFLSAPYTESIFAAVNFAGLLSYSQARIAVELNSKQTLREDILLLNAGAFFAAATWIRSNGLLSGLVFVYDVALCVPKVLKMQLSSNEFRKLAVTCVAGITMAMGLIVPQYIAYQEYCITESNLGVRPWCHKTIPSIYTWVQSHYWNVGFLRYWTLPNLPLFFLAAPMLWLLFQSSLVHLRDRPQQPSVVVRESSEASKGDSGVSQSSTFRLPQLALPQLVLTVTAATSFHVQVINRISSGYPMWYFTIATWILSQEKSQSQGNRNTGWEWLVRGMIMYPVVQGVLYASFLPPA